MHGWQMSARLMMFAGVVWAGMPSFDSTTTSAAEEAPAAAVAAPNDEAARRAAAVTLNYSRASFHRIRKNPTLRVLTEEQEKILNHLNLNGIADEEVLKLYSSVLDEIAQIQLADREKTLLKGKHSQQFQSNIGFNALALTMQMATAQYASAVRTGASSWWDYRNFSTNRDLDLHKIDKERMTKLVEKSSRFLDVSWKTARTRQIPDRWLVRGDDLDKLELAWQEPDPATRLRVLKRMEPFMECYPPYWYYVARTEQALGQLPVASQTFGRMADIGQGHFRKDEMLSAGLANRALIQAFLKEPEAAETARLALSYSSDVWEANLSCASVLQRTGDVVAAEDAILRNLDVELENVQSRVALVTLYYDSNDRQKLASQLNQMNVVRVLPATLLAECAATLGEAETPPLLAQVLERSLQATPRYNLGKDDLLIQATSNWQLDRARLRLEFADGSFVNPRIVPQADHLAAWFDGVGELSGRDLREVKLTLEYPDRPALTLKLAMSGTSTSAEESNTLVAALRRPPVYRVAAYEQGGMKLSLQDGILLSAVSPRSMDGTQSAAQPVVENTATNTPLVKATTFKPAVPDDADPYFLTPEIEVPRLGTLP